MRGDVSEYVGAWVWGRNAWRLNDCGLPEKKSECPKYPSTKRADMGDLGEVGDFSDLGEGAEVGGL